MDILFSTQHHPIKSIKQEKQEVDLRVELVKTNQERFRRGFISAFQLSEQINEKEEQNEKETTSKIMAAKWKFRIN